MRWAGHVARMGEGKGAYRFLVGRPEGKRLLGRPRRGWKDNIKMDLREITNYLSKITPWSRVLFKKLIFTLLFKQFRAFY
jgi:hypothetical protein